ncbi:MAG: hypothetical protein HC769_26415 [Cyanobacteria bacterium CRU_2_1]|nr:hypothetical protein [Cyanobacteria bacterium RU_5_0]NJR62048.1 hypothetical protein [Cyanobacteria bacterium CRU_2_1]
MKIAYDPNVDASQRVENPRSVEYTISFWLDRRIHLLKPVEASHYG